MRLLLPHAHRLRTFKHWTALLFFSASIVILYWFSIYSYDPCEHKLAFNRPQVSSGDEPHYLIIISSILSDGDVSLANNYQSVRLGGMDAGREYRGRNLDHHTLVQDARTGEGVLWDKIFSQFIPADCDLGDPSCVGFKRISALFPDYTPESPNYRELPQHALPFPALLALILRLIGARANQIESHAIYLQVFLSWVAGVITYLCALKAGLGAKSSLGAVSVLYFASPWFVYSHELFPATFMGLFLIGALWAFLSRRFAIAAAFLAIAGIQSEVFVLIFPAWVLLLYLTGERSSALRFALVGFALLTSAALINRVLLGAVSIRYKWFFFRPVLWRTFLEPEKGVWFFAPWSVAAFCFLIFSFFYRGREVAKPLRVMAVGIFPAAAVFMIIFNTGSDCYGPRYWVPLIPWLSLAFVLGAKNYWQRHLILVRPILILLVVLSAVISVTAAILSPLVVPFWNKTPWYASRIFFDAYSDSYDKANPNIRCPRNELQLWLGQDCNQPSRSSAAFTLPTPVKGTALAVVSRLACSVQFPDGVEVVHLRLIDTDGKSQVHRLLVGRDSSEWAYDCKSVRPHMQHQRATIYDSYRAKLFDEPCEGHFYFTKKAFEGVKEIRRIELEWVGGSGGIIVDKVILIDEITKSSYKIDSASMESK